MPRKRSLKKFVSETEEMAKLGWECYRRNDDYCNGYAQIFKNVIDDKELKNLVKLEDVKTDDDLAHWKNSQEEFERKWPGLYIFKSDVEALRRLKPNESYYGASIVIPSGHAFIIVFCDEWLIRYPKNPKEDFKDSKDKNLFVGLTAVSVSKHRLEHEAQGAFHALEKLTHLMVELPEMYRRGFGTEGPEIKLVDAINIIKGEWKGIEELGQKFKDDGEITFVVNANRSLDEITAPINGYLNAVARKRKRKRSNVLAYWQPMIEIWDLMKDKEKNDKQSYSKVAEELDVKYRKTHNPKQIKDDYKRIDGIIRECTNSKWPSPILRRF